MFKSLTIYQLTQATDAVLKRLDAALASKPLPLRRQGAGALAAL